MRVWFPLLALLPFAGCKTNDAATPVESDTDTDADSDADTDSDADSDTDADSNTDTDSDTDSDTDADTDSDTDADTDSDTDADTDSDTDADTDSDTDADTYADTDADMDADTDADSDTDTDATGDTGIMDTGPFPPCVLSGATTAPVDPAPVGTDTWRRLGWRPIQLLASGPVPLSVTGPFEVTNGAGVPITTANAPTTVYVRATGSGSGVLSGSGACTGSIQLTDRWRDDLVGQDHPDVPLTPVDAFPLGRTLRFALDPLDWPDVTGPVDVYLVESRDRDAWLAQRDLVDVRGAPTSWSAGVDFPSSTIDLATFTTPVLEPWLLDVVVDLDGDGELDAGEPIDGLDGPGAMLLPDLSAAGPFAVATQDDTFPYNTARRVWWPTPLPDEPLPLVVISHGVGHEYTWYDDLGEQLASHGAIVFAHRNQTTPGFQTAANSILDNIDAFFADLPTAHPQLVGQVDASRMLLIGHSRGGEGVLRVTRMLDDGLASLPSPAAAVVGVSAIAPTIGLGPEDSGPGDRAFQLVTGSADGDVSGGVLHPTFLGPNTANMWFRHLQVPTNHRSSYLHGAAHDHFNSDGPDTGGSIDVPVDTRDNVQARSRALHTALLYETVLDTPAIAEVFARSPAELALTTSDFAGMRTVLSPDALLVEDFSSGPDTALSSLGAEVRWTVTDLFEGPLDDADLSLAWDPTDPMNGCTQSENDDPAIAKKGVVFGFDSDAFWEVDLPAPTDVSAFDTLLVDLAQGTQHPDTLLLAGSLVLELVLVDSAGTEAVASTTAYADVPTPYAREGGWINAFQTVRVPLVDFRVDQPGFDRSAVQTIRLAFGPSHGSERGRVLLQRIALD
jgi:alpha-beta hydrolase superfamily lysophospholipase